MRVFNDIFFWILLAAIMNNLEKNRFGSSGEFRSSNRQEDPMLSCYTNIMFIYRDKTVDKRRQPSNRNLDIHHQLW